jgi:hypothetical protein
VLMDEYPRPQRDGGCGIHWLPVLSQNLDVIDRVVSECQQMGIRRLPITTAVG